MNRTTHRRQFLRTSAAAVGAAASTLAMGRPLRSAEPGSAVKLGIMGTGARGRALASQFSKLPGCHIGYVCDVDERAVGAGVTAVDRRLAERPKTVTDVRRILDDKQIDALVIAAPDHWHAPAAILACAAGKHVYVEKPASHNGHEGMLLIEAARKHKRHVQMGNQRRSSEKIAEAIGLLKEGEIGKVLFARGWITSTRKNIGHGKETPVPAGFDYTLWQGPAPDAPFRDNVHPYQWHWFWNWGTGELGNNGIHAIDLCRWGMGVDYPTHVTCAGGKYYFDDDQETPDTQIATFHFGERAINWEHRTWHKRGFEGHSFGVTFYGSRGTLLLVGNNYTFYDSDGKKTKQTAVDRGDKHHLVNFLDAVRSDTKLNSEIEEGVKSTTLCHLGNIAYRVGQTVKFDPEKKTIVGSTQAAVLWKRQYRSGWEPAV